MNKVCPWCGKQPSVRRVGNGGVILVCCHWESEAFETVPEAFKWFDSWKNASGRPKKVV